MKNLLNKKVILLTITLTLFSLIALSQGKVMKEENKLRESTPIPQTSSQIIKESKSTKTEISEQTQQEDDNDLADYQKMENRIQSLIDARDLFGLVKLSDEIVSDWRKKTAKYYAGLMFQVCGAMGSYDFDNDEQYVFARKCTKRALEQSEQIPVYWELKLVSLLNGDIEYVLNLAPNENWAKDRKERLKYWCRAWQKLERELDENFDFEANRPIYHVKMTTEERQKAEKYNQQRFLQRDKKTFISQFQNFLIEAYAKQPYNLPELKEYLKKYVADEDLKSTVLSEVEKRMSDNEN